jgi:hypothetical protein
MRFMEAAGVLIVRSFAAEAKRPESGGNPRTYAHVVALGPMRMRKEHTSTKWLDIVLGWRAEVLPPCVNYTLVISPTLVIGATSSTRQVR